MPIYIAVPLTPTSATLDEAVESLIPKQDQYRLQSNSGWLIRFDGTTVELSNKLTITGQPKGEHSPIGSAIVIPVAGYYGRGPNDMWEWLKTRLEQ